jgi:flagellar hook-associated protein 2
MANTIGQLDASFTNLISNLMVLERQPLTRLTAQRDTLNVKKGIYNDLKSKVDAMQSAIRTLTPSDPFFSLNPGRKVSVTSNTTGSTIASASAGSTSVPGTYIISDVVLAKAHSVMSARQAYTDQALGLAGTVVMGGYASRSVNASTPNAAVDVMTTNETLLTGQQELGTGTYYVETRTYEGAQQFRLVDSDGKAISIRNGATSSVTTGWQALPAAGDFDTGRGLVLHFTGVYAEGQKGSGAANLDYQAKGANLDILATDTLVEIASKVNNATYAAGNEVQASIIDNQLILTNKYSGLGKSIVSSGAILDALGITSGGNYTNVIHTGSNASFKVNGMPIIRSQNTGLSDVISGVTLNLSADAEGAGKTATLSITSEVSAQKNAVQDFLNKFNGLLTYINQKTAVTKKSDGTYDRAALAGDAMVSSLKMDLGRMLTATYANAGTYSKLRDIGVSMDENGQAVISDSAKLENALNNNFANTKLFLDSVMTGILNKANRYTGTSSYVETAIKAVEKEADNVGNQITSLNERLEKREQQLYDQFAAAQTQLQLMSYQQQQISAGMSYLSNIYG